jgi:hypothetical protein
MLKTSGIRCIVNFLHSYVVVYTLYNAIVEDEGREGVIYEVVTLKPPSPLMYYLSMIKALLHNDEDELKSLTKVIDDIVAMSHTNKKDGKDMLFGPHYVQ